MDIQVSEKEIKNAEKVLLLLSQIDGISYEQQEDRPDIFVVNEEDTQLSLIVDVEEDTVVAFIEVTPFSYHLPEGLGERLLGLNNGAVHGAFTINNQKLYFKSNLQIENLDLNELEASIRSVFYTVNESLPVIHKYFSK